MRWPINPWVFDRPDSDYIITMVRRSTCYFSGHVQGVGFRYTAMQIARDYDVVGFVRNLPDGRVELVIEGQDTDRTGFIAAIHEQMGDYIHNVQTTDSAATGEFLRFGVHH